MTTVAEMVTEAKRQIENLTVDEVAGELEHPDVVLVDIREPAELAYTGVIPGAIQVPRGMVEFLADPSSPFHREEFQPGGRIILYCAVGGRSALAAVTLKELGFGRAAHLEGGIVAWQEAGKPVTEELTG